MNKTFNTVRMRRGCHVLSTHDGVKVHADNSPFFDIEIFRNARALDSRVKELKSAGYAKI